MVRSAYSSGKPAIGVGAGNTPAVIDKSADIRVAVSSIIHSKTFDNGVICASEQAIVVDSAIYERVKTELTAQGAYFLSEDETQKMRELMFGEGKLNPKIVGQTAKDIAELCGIQVCDECKILVGEVESVGEDEPFAKEKLSPVLAMYKARDFSDALDKADALVKGGGLGHTASIFIDEYKAKDRLDAFCARMKACRVLVNTPASQGGIGDLYNFRLTHQDPIVHELFSLGGWGQHK